MGEAVAESVITRMATQIELLTTLSVGVVAAIAALLVQIILHNSDSSKKELHLKKRVLLQTACIIEMLAIVLGYLSHGSITSHVPEIYEYFDNPESIEMLFVGRGLVQGLNLAQFASFIIGITVLLIFVFCNLNLVNGGKK